MAGGTVPYCAFTMNGYGYCEKFNGTSWSLVGGGFGAGSVISTSLAVVGTTPYVAFGESYAGAYTATTAMAYNGSSWVYVGSSPDFEYNNPAIYMGLTMIGSTPYVLGVNGNGYNTLSPALFTYNGSSWGLVGSAGFAHDVNSSSWELMSYRMDSNGTPYFAFSDYNAPGYGYISVMKYQ